MRLLNEKVFFDIFKILTVCYDLVSKTLYLFISGFVDFYSAEGSEGKLNFFLKMRSLALCFASLSFFGRLCIFSFLLLNEKIVKILFYNDLVVERVVAYFYDSSKHF